MISRKLLINDLGKSLTDLSIGFGKLIILGDWNTPWLNQQNDYPPVAKAIEFLNQKIDKNVFKLPQMN